MVCMKKYTVLSIYILLCCCVYAQADKPPFSAPADTLISTIPPDSLLTLIAPDSLTAVKTTVYDSLFYSADSLFYDVDIEEINLIGDAKIIYGTSTISADSISLNLDRDTAKASGRIMMEDVDQLILGSEAHYDINTEAGLVFNGISRFDLGFYYGDEIRKVGDNVFDLDDGSFTTCDCKVPHFDIRSHTMRVYREHMVVAKPVVFYVNDFPILGLPFAAISIKRGRQSGILVPEPGFSQSDGKYFRNIAYFYAINDYSDITLRSDIMEKTGSSYNVDFNYLKRYYYEGKLYSYYHYRTLTPDTYRNDWAINYRHFQNLPEKATFDVTLDFASSKVWEDNVDVNKRLTERITSSISYRKPFANSSLYASGSYTDDFLRKPKQKTITLPSVSYSMPSKPIHEFFSAIPDSTRRQDHWWKDFSVNWSGSALHSGTINDNSPTLSQVLYENNHKDANQEVFSQHNAGVRQNASLSWNTSMFTWLKLGNSLSYQDVIQDRDRLGNKLVHRYAYSTSHNASFNIYGLRRFTGLPVEAVRHIVTPSVGFRFSPDFYEKNKNLYSFMSVPAGRKQRMINVGVDNKWQFRLRPNADGQARYLNDLFVYRVSSSYDLEKEKEPWSDINNSLTINPGSYDLGLLKFDVSQNYSGNMKPYEHFNIMSWRMNSSLNISGDAFYYDYFPQQKNDFITRRFYNADSDTLSIAENQVRTIQDLENLQRPGSWSVNTSHDYSYDRRYKNENQNLRNSLNMKLTEKWAVSYSNYVDLKENIMMSQSLTITRDIHCWKMTFTYTKSANFWDYRIVLLNIKLPDSLKVQTGGNSL